MSSFSRVQLSHSCTSYVFNPLLQCLCLSLYLLLLLSIHVKVGFQSFIHWQITWHTFWSPSSSLCAYKVSGFDSVCCRINSVFIFHDFFTVRMLHLRHCPCSSQKIYFCFNFFFFLFLPDRCHHSLPRVSTGSICFLDR